MSKRYVNRRADGTIGPVPPPKEVEAVKNMGSIESPRGVSIDDLLFRGLYALDLMLKHLLHEVTTHAYTRDTILNLKDVMGMLQELKKKESELIDNMSEEDIKKLLNETNQDRSS